MLAEGSLWIACCPRPSGAGREWMFPETDEFQARSAPAKWHAGTSPGPCRRAREAIASGPPGTLRGDQLAGRCAMDWLPRPRLRFGWAAPAGAVIVVGAVLGGTLLASAAAPHLPRRTPAQLLASIAHAKLPRAMTATLTESANLGFPALPDIAGSSSSPLSAASLISGTHTIEVWYAGPRHVRIALPVPFGETDLRVNGSQVWLWNSSGQTATHILPPVAGRYVLPGAAASFSKGVKPCRAHVKLRGSVAPTPTAMTPLRAAKRLLALIGPTTRVTVPGTTVVAGRD